MRRETGKRTKLSKGFVKGTLSMSLSAFLAGVLLLLVAGYGMAKGWTGKMKAEHLVLLCTLLAAIPSGVTFGKRQGREALLMVLASTAVYMCIWTLLAACCGSARLLSAESIKTTICVLGGMLFGNALTACHKSKPKKRKWRYNK